METKIAALLESMNLKFEQQKSFDDCINVNKLKFDFYVSSLNLLIEYDGEYHYKPLFGQKNLDDQITRDNIKNQYCKSKKINLLRISYLEKENIEKILMQINKFNSSYNENYNLDIRKLLN